MTPKSPLESIPPMAACARCRRPIPRVDTHCRSCGHRAGRPLALSRPILAFDAALILAGVVLGRVLSRQRCR